MRNNFIPRVLMNNNLRPRGKLFTLSDLGSEAFAFYDMNNGITDAGMGKVSGWNDALGNSTRDISQSTGSACPTLTSDGVVFNGESEYLFNTNPFMANSVNGVMGITIVSAPPATFNVAEWGISEGSTISNNQIFGLLHKDTDLDQLGLLTQRMKNDDNSTILTYGGNSGSTVAFDDSFKIICHKFDKVNRLITTWINGMIESPPLPFTLSGSFTLNRFSIGALARVSPFGYFQGTFKCIAITDASISENDRQKAEGYLTHLYSLSSLLPSNHPYKINRPQV